MNEAMMITKVWILSWGGKWTIALDIWNSTWCHSLDSLRVHREHKEQLLPAFRDRPCCSCVGEIFWRPKGMIIHNSCTHWCRLVFSGISPPCGPAPTQPWLPGCFYPPLTLPPKPFEAFKKPLSLWKHSCHINYPSPLWKRLKRVTDYIFELRRRAQ